MTVIDSSKLKTSTVTITDAAKAFESDGVELRGFTIQNGIGSRAERLNNERAGGGLYCVNAHAVVRDCQFIDNTAYYGGGLYHYAGSITLEDCLFLRNEARRGAGAYLDHPGRQGHTTLERVEFTGNVASEMGGGLLLWYGGNRLQPTVRVLDCLFQYNDGAGVGGGGALAASVPNIRFERCRFYSNLGGRGGGVYIDASDFYRVVDCDFEFNFASKWNGGWGGGASLLDGGQDGLVERCRFRSNFASRDAGGALITGRVNACVFEGNVSAQGGAVLAERATFSSSLFLNNEATSFGGAIAGDMRIDAYHCTFVRNRAPMTSIADYRVELYNCIIADGNQRPYGGFSAAYSLVEGGWIGAGNFDADPQFVDAIAGDYRLGPDSPALDAGSHARFVEMFEIDEPRLNAIDLDGELRLASPFADLGAFERPVSMKAPLTLATPGPYHGEPEVSTQVGAATPGATVVLVAGGRRGVTPVPGCSGLVLELARPRVVGRDIADEWGVANRFLVDPPPNLSGRRLLLQAVTDSPCEVTELVEYRPN
ncbi:MAG: right-handed parallel beta-helix repeat-containing protein [Phycisphaerales bacterium]